ncbi:uncharacterized protein K460DRAFT_288814 [Cucurbitaria berberidis CBS 394.84]|uniref:Letm1 RBD domain-containing protein n=1 Tax=Cucurbitaria berberidis CBS 394.84 TaxID=1168544 RepID=A0A9P4GED4_9PLEO|nr:uncharacterized protein K460DRAFT_288814 [Cucurbitaria berberidis CBS 394.84]KAF1844067.1 hypothetical protein K460DRAFT_288814 [Cucurbitaria berberidis CBS 394.84]
MPPPPAKSTGHAKDAKTSVPAKHGASPGLSSSTTVLAKRPSTASTTVPIVKAKENLNPPLFTYAPEINIPARKADQNIASYLWAAGRGYLSFYKTGISHVRQTAKLAKQLREKAAKSSGQDMSEVLTRAEWQIVLRSKKDVRRLPAFAALMLCMGEWTPLIVIYLTPVIPEACRIPSQVQRTLGKIEKIRQERLRRVTLDSTRLMMKDRRAGGTLPTTSESTDFKKNAQVMPGAAVANFNLESMSPFELLLTSAQYNCHSRIFDWLYLTPPKWLLQRNVGQRLGYLWKDDALIERDGGWAALNKVEVERACVERGINVLGKREDELRKALVVQWKGGNA